MRAVLLPQRTPVGLLLAVALVCATPAARAVENIDVDLFRPQFTWSLSSIPNAEFSKDSECRTLAGGGCGGEYGATTGSLGANIPLGKTHIRTEGRVRAWQLLANVRFDGESADLTFLNESPRKLYDGGLNLAGLWLTEKSNLWLVSAGASYAEDTLTMFHPSLRFSALAVVAHPSSAKWTWLWGGAFTYQYGRALPLPLVGFLWKPSDRWLVASIVPITIRAAYTATEHLTVQIGAGVHGNAYRLSNNGLFPQEPDTVFFRYVELRLTGGIEYRVGPHLTLAAEGGVAGARHIVISENDRGTGDEIRVGSPEPAPVALVSARVTFGMNLLERMKSE